MGPSRVPLWNLEGRAPDFSPALLELTRSCALYAVAPADLPESDDAAAAGGADWTHRYGPDWCDG